MSFSRQMSCFLAAIFLLAASASAQYSSSTSNPLPGVSADAVKPSCASGVPGVISVTGNGQATATADVATVNLKLSVQRPTADDARQLAGSIADTLVSSVSKINGISPTNITSGAVSVNAVTQYNSSASTSTTIGYTFVNTLSVRIGNLTSDKLSSVLDTSVANGGNNLTISSVDFSLSQALSIAKTLEAQQTASDDANNTAQQYAKGMKVALGPVLSITDQSSSLSSSSSSSTYGSSSSSSSSVAGAPSSGSYSTSSNSTPVTIGSQRVQARILVVYTVCNPIA